MERDLRRLADERFDVLVVGAGIYGVTIAWDATQRGLSVALIDRDDFGAATSFNNHKTVHGGLRSLQQANLPEMREFIRERRALSRIAPHLVHPMPFVIPTYRHPLRSRMAMRMALALHNLVAHDRNDQPDPSKHLPPGHTISRAECLRVNPLIDPAGVTGGATWHDCHMYNTDRVTLAFVLSAAAGGCAAANHLQMRELILEQGRVRGARARDRLGGDELDIRASVVVNAAGPWAPAIAAAAPGTGRRVATIGLSRAMNLVTRRLPGDRALGGLARGRYLFLIPWRDVSVIGTSHDPFDGQPDTLRVTTHHVEDFLADVREAFPAADVGADDVRLVHRGLLPTRPGNGARVRLLKQSLIHDHQPDGLEGLVSVLGVRYTTARHTAERAVDLLFERAGRPAPPCRTATTPLAGGDVPRFDDFLAGASTGSGRLTDDDRRRLVMSYGSEFSRLTAAMTDRPDDAVALGRDCRVTRAEIRHAVREEMALRLADAVFRRTEAGSAGHPGVDALESAAAVMAEELGWDPARRRDEIARVTQTYAIAGARTHPARDDEPQP